MSDTLSLNVNVFLRSVIKASQFPFAGAMNGLLIFLIVISVGVVVFMVKLSWRLSMVTLIGLPIVMGVSSAYGQYYKVTFCYAPCVTVMVLFLVISFNAFARVVKPSRT